MPERKCVGCDRKVEWGCEAFKYREPPTEWAHAEEFWINPAYVQIDVDGEALYSCPRQDLYKNPKQWDRLLKFYNMYKNGFLPDDGPVSWQSNVMVQAFRLLDGINAEIDAELQEKRNRPKGPRDGTNPG